MKDVIFMSSRAQPGLFNTWAETAQTLGLPNDSDWLLILALFEAGTDGWVTPEFTWNPTRKFLMWTENRFPDGYRYPLPPNPTEYLQSLEELLQNPPSLSLDTTSSGVGVAPFPVQQRTVIGTFQSTGGSASR